MLAEFTRIAWSSDHARSVWEPRVKAIQDEWARVEVESVGKIRPAALVFGKPKSSLPQNEVAPGRFVVAHDWWSVEKFQTAWARRDDLTIGMLLGFPACCRDAFNRIWNDEKRIDTTLSMHGVTSGPVNILGRWLGVRTVPHLPCAWSCDETLRAGMIFDEFWDVTTRGWRDEILAWPVKYSALHGVAEITFPVVKIVTNTDYTACEQVIERPGTRYPAEGARGTRFPFRLENPVKPLMVVRDTWTANGFPSQAAMDEAHEMILQWMKQPAGGVLDLGCGNGVLLKKIERKWNCPIRGIDSEKKGSGDWFIHGNLRDVARLAQPLVPHLDTIVVSQRRFEEMPELKDWCRANAPNVLVYSYDEPRFARYL